MLKRGDIFRDQDGYFLHTRDAGMQDAPVTGMQDAPVTGMQDAGMQDAGMQDAGMQDAPVENPVPKKKSRIRFGPAATIPAEVPPIPGTMTPGTSGYVRTPGVKQTPAGYVIPGKPLPLGCYVHPETILLTLIPEITD
jgi:hypothetical protein